jgi:hypothetical protein
MVTIYIAWAVSAVVLVAIAVWLGMSIRRSVFGVLIDSRGRYSLSQFQLVLWTLVLLSLIAGVFWGRLLGDAEGGALNFTIPSEVLMVLGINLGSTTLAKAIKTSKDTTRPETVAASDERDPPRFQQVFLLEEGEMADKVVDVTKLQKFAVTLILLVAYVALAITTIDAAASISDIRSLPGFAATFVTLLGLSHAGYLGGKLPSPPGVPDGTTMLHRMDPEEAARRVRKRFSPRNQPRAARREAGILSPAQVAGAASGLPPPPPATRRR